MLGCRQATITDAALAHLRGIEMEVHVGRLWPFNAERTSASTRFAASSVSKPRMRRPTALAPASPSAMATTQELST